MRKLLFTALFAFALPFSGAAAFQVLGPEQMQESGLNLTEQGYFSAYGSNGGQSGQVQFLGSARHYDGVNYYGRHDSGGRFYGDRRNSNFRGCAGGFSNAAQLDAMSGAGYAYPCQRFR